ncbi:MAG: hypothetical protein ACTSYG_13085 [Candidatus Heimdallarchaeota archaeon]
MVEEDTSVYTAAAQKAFIIKISGTKDAGRESSYDWLFKSRGVTGPQFNKEGIS